MRARMIRGARAAAAAASALLLCSCIAMALHEGEKKREAYLAGVDVNPAAFQALCREHAGVVLSAPLSRDGVFLPPWSTFRSAVDWLQNTHAPFVDVVDSPGPPWLVDRRGPVSAQDAPRADGRQLGVDSPIYRVRLTARPSPACAPFDAWRTRVRAFQSSQSALDPTLDYQTFITDPLYERACIVLEPLRAANAPRLEGAELARAVALGEPTASGESARYGYEMYGPSQSYPVNDKLVASASTSILRDLTTGREVARSESLTLVTRESFLTDEGGGGPARVNACDGSEQGRPTRLSQAPLFAAP